MKAILLNREDFKQLVFDRDKHKCICCPKPAVDAHHLIDRSLWIDGGFYIQNGVSLCSKHHIDAETTSITTSELRQKAGITELIYPHNLSLTEFVKDYDKWGNPVLKTGKRLKGYIFEQENVQKMLKQGNVLHLFEKEDNSGKPDKYGRTYHFPFSEGTTSDDRIAKNYNNLCSGEIVMTEKLDGENNLLISEFGVFTRSRVEPTKNPWSVKMWDLFYKIKNDIKGLEVYGESIYAEHSIIYSGLKEYFFIFGIKDIETDMWLSWKETEEFAYLLGLPTVPVLFKSINDFSSEPENLKNMILNFMKTPSKLSNDKFWITPKEGVVCRLANSYPNDMFFNSILKFVRKNHVKTDEHWSKNWRRTYLEDELNTLSDEQLKQRYFKLM